MKMIERCYGGIDVSKDRLDVEILPDQQRFSVDNNAVGWSELVERLHRLSATAIGIEPSGGYERGVIRSLLVAGRRCDGSTPTSFVSSPVSVACWPRTIASMRG